MKIGIVGCGAVGGACALSVVTRGSARELVLLDLARKRARAVATDLKYDAPLSPRIDVRDGDYADLAGAALVMITAGVNEKTGGATDRNDAQGRLRLLYRNARIYEDVVPKIVAAAPEAVILVVTDPPEPLTDVARRLAGHDRVIGSGTFLDSLRFRVHLAERLGFSPDSVDAHVVGEHGKSAVFLWSAVKVGAVPVADLAAQRGLPFGELRRGIEQAVRDANINIIEGNEASRFGIGVVAARIAEIVLRDERAVIPIGSHNAGYGVALSLPSVVGRRGVAQILEPAMSEEERQALERSVEMLRQAEGQTARDAAE
ncbi:MAG TPA: L-lactate dehydrogenase [Stellaceae bacterium]|nr:L-lactate dehydrogenase [Stellaceae bacterium]